MIRQAIVWTACVAVIGIANQARAVSYASGLKDLGGGTYEYILNADASDVTIDITGGATLNEGALSAGRHTFNIGAGTAFDINVSSNFAADSKISSDTNEFLWFERPNGLEINTDPTSEFFGTIYVVNGTDFSVSVPGFRAQGDGVYTLAADQTGLNPAGRTEVTDVNDTASQVNAPASWIVAGSSASAWRLTLDDDNNLIVSDWANANSGIKYAAPDLQSGGLVLAGQGDNATHGSIVSQVTTTGAIGDANFAVWAIDEDLESSPGAGNGNNLWRWDVGAGTDFAGAPNLVIDGANIAGTTGGASNWLDLNVGVLADAVYSATHNKWYLTQNRNDGNEAGLIIITPDGVDGTTPTVEFSSLQFTEDNGLDGQVGTLDALGDPIGNGTQDIIRNAGQITLSPDGDYLLLNRIAVDDGIITNIIDEGDPNDPNDDITEDIDIGNPHLGRNSNQPGSLLKIPLDASGIPVITLDDNGTPGDPLDDLITNWDSVSLIADTAAPGTNAVVGTRAAVRVDAAGNLYTASNSREQVEVFSAGGDKVATTSNNAALSAGAFSVMDASACIPGDTDGDGDVDLVDLDNLGANFGLMSGATKAQGDFDGDGDVDLVDLDALGANFGTGVPATAVPEPSTMLLGALALAGLAARRR